MNMLAIFNYIQVVRRLIYVLQLNRSPETSKSRGQLYEAGFLLHLMARIIKEVIFCITFITIT